MTDIIREITKKVLEDVPRLPGELELLEFLKTTWSYGGTLDQIEACWRNIPNDSPSVPQLLDILVAFGDVELRGNFYVPVRD